MTARAGTRTAGLDDGEALHLAISGTYSTGKSTTTEAISIASGIPRTHAMTSREILLDLVPGKQVQELNAMELTMLGLRRFEERVHNESGAGSFISDGSVIHEWVYGAARLKAGINPGAHPLLRSMKYVAGLPIKRYYEQYMHAYGEVCKARARRLYDAYVHLPVEFDMVPDGHRPVSEKFRRLSDSMLLDTLEEMQIPYHVVSGTVEERVTTVLRTFEIPALVPVEEAVALAHERVAAASAVLEADDRLHEARRTSSLRRRVRYALRY